MHADTVEITELILKAAEKARKMGVREVEIRVKGPGSGRESAIRSLSGPPQSRIFSGAR